MSGHGQTPHHSGLSPKGGQSQDLMEGLSGLQLISEVLRSPISMDQFGHEMHATSITQGKVRSKGMTLVLASKQESF